ncbi:MAG: gliding motility-associated C-terminal domain-containing protein, partial [Ginsengibacter sp.]
WINNTTGISDINVPDPSALTKSPATYTVVGYDNYNCFTDTAGVVVNISKLPVVNAGKDTQLISGASVTLSPTVTGATSWNWSPADYLNCTSCLTPVSKPRISITYTLTAYNAEGCKAKDEVSLHLACKESMVYIPNAFSPNHDNVNDRFNIAGSGIKKIISIIVYNRWGKAVFEKQNININDVKNSWDGTSSGEPLPVGVYVYMIQTECEGGEVFKYSGSVLLLR